MLKINNLSYSFPQKDLYEEISFSLEKGQHCAFIGVSGSGKSTLTDFIMDPEKYMFTGDLEIEEASRIGYVSQFSQIKNTKELTVFQFLAEKYIDLQEKLQDIAKEMETSSEIETLLEEYQETSDALEAIGGDDFESKINKTLNLAELIDHKDLMISELSGGEFKLVQVIKEMLTLPDLMIMDEPDVFLDFENLNSLKDLINSYKGTLLVITHNRYLLNHCFNKIIHLENMQLQEFDGRYIDYNFSLLESKIELQELAHIDNEEIKRNEALIKKFRFAAEQNPEARIGQHVNSRVKIQERLIARRVKEPFVFIKEPDMSFTTDNELQEDIALKVEDYSVAFDDVLLEDVSFEIASKDKAVIIGQNGTGKSTLLRDLFKNKNEAIKFGEGVEVAYLSQLQGEMLDESNTVKQELFDAGFKTSEEILLCLSRYGLEESIANQKISSLSGGEKNILQIIKISISQANMLLLDEPTSHLDTYSQIALERALDDYNGAILMVSHDFYTIVNSMDYVLIIEDKSIRKMKLKKFKQMIYKRHFDKDYLEIELEIKTLENKIEMALKNNDFELAKVLSQELEVLIKSF
nr:ATP-binding cassette domain-containing protein [Tissierella sp.]